MGYLTKMTGGRLTRLLVAGTLVGIGTPLLLGAGSAQAGDCAVGAP